MAEVALDRKRQICIALYEKETVAEKEGGGWVSIMILSSAPLAC